MDTVAPDIVRPKQSEVLPNVGSPRQDEELLRQTVVPAVQTHIPSFTHEQAIPAAGSPISKTPELQQVGAQIIGNEDNSALLDDIEHYLKIARSPITGESIWARMGRAIRGTKILNIRNAKVAKVGMQKDPGQMDIGE